MRTRNILTAEQSRAEQSRAEQSRAEQTDALPLSHAQTRGFSLNMRRKRRYDDTG